MELKGKIVALRIAYLKFPVSGKLASVNCKVGDQVRKGQLLATLNKTELQAYLDRALKEYDLERAMFDENQKENLTPYEKRKYQDELDISVKNVEIAKANLDATDLYSSINGIIVAMDYGQIGDNITPAGFVIAVVDPTSLYFQAEAAEEDLPRLAFGQTVKISLKGFPEKEIEGKIEQISFIPTKEGYYPVSVSIPASDGLRPGLSGKISF